MNECSSPNAAHDPASSSVSFDQTTRTAECVGGASAPRPGGPCVALGDEIAAQRMVTRFVAELMAWRAHLDLVDKLECAIERPMASTNFSAVLVRGCVSGVLGTGNRGSKGVWSGEGPIDALIGAAEASKTLGRVARRDDEWCARYNALPDELRELARWIRDHTQGEAPKVVCAKDPPGYVIEYAAEGKRPARRIAGLSLAEIVGLSTVEPKQRARWEGKMRSGDSSPARAGMRERGESLLIACAEAWFSSSA